MPLWTRGAHLRPFQARTALAAAVVAAVMVVPLVFDSGRGDAFALPKANALRWLGAGALVPAAYLFATRGLRGLAVHRALDISVAAFVALNLLAFGLSSDVGQSFVGERLQYQGLLATLLYVTFFYLARLSLAPARRVIWLLSAIAVTGTVVAGYAILQKVGLDPVWDDMGRERVFSTIGQPNALAAYLVVVIPVGMALIRHGPGLTRVLGWAALVTSLPALGWTLSRGGYAGVLAVALVLAIPAVAAAGTGVPLRRVAAAAAFVALVLAALVAAPPARGEADRIWGRATSSFDVDSWEGLQRLSLWKVGWRIATDHPLVGTGQETFPEMFPEYRDRVLTRAEAATLIEFRPESPHNVYLAIAGGAGFPALAAYLGVLGSWFVVVARARRSAQETGVRVLLLGLMAAVAGHTVTDFFMTAEVTGSLVTWVLLGAGAALVGVSQRESRAA